MLYDIVFTVFLFFLGACVGSFMDVVRTRGQWRLSLKGRSSCTSCASTLCWYELVPIVSYLWLRGKCRKCSRRIPPQHLLSEVLMGTLFACAFIIPESLTTSIAIIIASIFLVPIVIADIETMEIPGHLSLPFTCIALGFAVVVILQTMTLTPIVNALILAAPFYFIWLLSKGKAMGLGDTKVALPLGLLLAGAIDAASVFMFSFWVGVVGIGIYTIHKRIRDGSFPRLSGTRIPFVPSIAMAYLIVALFGISLVDISVLLYGIDWGGV